MTNPSIKIIKNTFKLIDKQDKRKVFLLIPIYIVLAITDLIGVALLGSVGTLGFKIISGNKQKSRIENIIDQLFKHEYSLTSLTMFLLICSLTVLTIRMACSSYLSYRLVGFQARLQTNAATKLYKMITNSDISQINYNRYSDYQYALLISSSRTISAGIGVTISIF
jgi:ABC-type multidrug transport system fused ATPase/permease subunit